MSLLEHQFRSSLVYKSLKDTSSIFKAYTTAHGTTGARRGQGPIHPQKHTLVTLMGKFQHPRNVVPYGRGFWEQQRIKLPIPGGKWYNPKGS